MSQAIGLDIDASKVSALNAGRSDIHHIPVSAVAEQIRAGRFSASADFARIREVEAVIICVLTPARFYRLQPAENAAACRAVIVQKSPPSVMARWTSTVARRIALAAVGGRICCHDVARRRGCSACSHFMPHDMRTRIVRSCARFGEWQRIRRRSSKMMRRPRLQESAERLPCSLVHLFSAALALQPIEW